MRLRQFTAIRNETGRLSRRATLRAAGGALAATLAAGAGGRVVAKAVQDATPAANMQSNGFETELLGAGTPAGAPGREVQMIRFTFAPGASTEPHRRNGARIDYVASGTYTLTVVSGNVELQPGDGDRTTDRESLAPGDYMLEAGDSIFIDTGAVVASLNAGSGPLVLLSAAVAPAGELSTGSTPVATPAG